jgi:hypothetical protein
MNEMVGLFLLVCTTLLVYGALVLVLAGTIEESSGPEEWDEEIENEG